MSTLQEEKGGASIMVVSPQPNRATGSPEELKDMEHSDETVTESQPPQPREAGKMGHYDHHLWLKMWSHVWEKGSNSVSRRRPLSHNYKTRACHPWRRVSRALMATAKCWPDHSLRSIRDIVAYSKTLPINTSPKEIRHIAGLRFGWKDNQTVTAVQPTTKRLPTIPLICVEYYTRIAWRMDCINVSRILWI